VNLKNGQLQRIKSSSGKKMVLPLRVFAQIPSAADISDFPGIFLALLAFARQSRYTEAAAGLRTGPRKHR
jgi:hypothetical protein